MCLNPIFIINKAKSRYGGLEYLTVPCRNCSECSLVSQTDYLVRSLALFNSLPLNYSVFFCTLTFRNADLPRTNVYKQIDDEWKIIAHDVPTFNHQLYKRFRKNFAEHCMDTFHQPLYLLSTCEYGDKFHRPHYHCICCYPSQVDWKTFKSIIERYWHYGFTKNIGISRFDGQDHVRSAVNCIKYVVKYTCKFEQKWLPFYLRDSSLSTDLPPYEIKPKTFVSNGYGAVLESILTHSNYVNNSIILGIRGSDKVSEEYSLPSYYRRRYFTRSIVLTKSKEYLPMCDKPYKDKLKSDYHYLYKTRTDRINGYNDILIKDFVRSVDKKIHDFQLLMSDTNFTSYLFENDEDRSEFIIDVDKLKSDMLKCYLETYSSHSPFTSISHIPRFERTERRFICGSNYTPPNRSYLITWHKQDLQNFHRRALPWLPGAAHWIHVPAIDYFPWSPLPTDWYYIELGQFYLRAKRQHFASIKYENELEWYRLHNVEKCV